MSVSVVSVLNQFYKNDGTSTNRTRVFNCVDKDIAKVLIRLLANKSTDWANHVIDEHWDDDCDINLKISNDNNPSASLIVETKDIKIEETWCIADIASIQKDTEITKEFDIDDIPKVVEIYSKL